MLGRAWVGAISLFAIVLVVAACDDGGISGIADDAVRGSGNLATESRDVSGFDEIVILGSGEVLVEVTGTETLEIEAEDNILPLLTSEVVNGRLELGSDSSFSATRGITYTISAAGLEAVRILGSSDVTGSGIDTNFFEVAIAGSGNVDLAGTSDELTVEVSGSGHFDGADLKSATGTVKVTGSGRVLVDVTEDLTVEISGSGNVEYVGDPTLHETISGSGDVSRL